MPIDERIPFASAGMDAGMIFLVMLLVVGVFAACFVVIGVAFWFTSKVQGSKGLVSGALLGVLTVYSWQLLSMFLGRSQIQFQKFQSLLLNAAFAAALACLINVINAKRNRMKKMPTANQDGQADR